ncbi:MAG: type II toxin-antitoxin system RelE/ParE family toxin [Vicinamibacterales bacterium]
MLTIVETPEFIANAKTLMSEPEREDLIGYLAREPEAGALIPGTGGVRKLRWGLSGRGKRGGARVIYFFHSARMPLFLLTVFAKNQRADLSQAERNGLQKLTRQLTESYRRSRR